ncbi:PREDICTED: uncharacterized protein C3orf30 homolog [Chrysochloris asiatica]|uniref:Uncharacterized protein C3orf30 homolog n=1 Tax=Chrysochloris asiatica TaxID=185453 RepID=A0A9B0TNZ4_CHRAS|nr:PREDICTED: uncharacterized protein C3orf30 homolog [Chrysochloris asiatica]
MEKSPENVSNSSLEYENIGKPTADLTDYQEESNGTNQAEGETVFQTSYEKANQAEGRTSEQTGPTVSVQADHRASNLSDTDDHRASDMPEERMFDHKASRQAGKLENKQDWKISVQADLRVSEQTDRRLSSLADRRTSEQTDHRFSSQVGQRTFEQIDRRSIPTDRRNSEPIDRRLSAAMANKRISEKTDHRLSESVNRKTSAQIHQATEPAKHIDDNNVFDHFEKKVDDQDDHLVNKQDGHTEDNLNDYRASGQCNYKIYSLFKDTEKEEGANYRVQPCKLNDSQKDLRNSKAAMETETNSITFLENYKPFDSKLNNNLQSSDEALFQVLPSISSQLDYLHNQEINPDYMSQFEQEKDFQENEQTYRKKFPSVVYNDPYQLALRYMEKHNILQIFQITENLVYERPEDPLRFMLCQEGCLSFVPLALRLVQLLLALDYCTSPSNFLMPTF